MRRTMSHTSTTGVLREMKLHIDADACTGHGRCYVLAPEVFEPDDEGHSIVLHEEVPPEYEAKARLGVDNCPEQAISIVD